MVSKALELLVNPSFDEEWAGDHAALILENGEGGPFQERRQIGEIFTPSGWLTWFEHDESCDPVIAQPEVHRLASADFPERVRGAGAAMRLFTFSKPHRGGFLQRVDGVEPGRRVRLRAHAHAWSNHGLKGHGDCKDDPTCSCGAGRRDVVLVEAGLPPLSGDPWSDALHNFSFRIGIDPWGGENPDSPRIVWSAPLAIYNGYAPLQIEVEAQGTAVTVFLYSSARWAFRHNDAYWDDASLMIMDGHTPTPPPLPPPSPPEPLPGRGSPRVPYARTYVLLPPGADSAWAAAVVVSTWDKHRFTVGGSADDAGIGDLKSRRVIAVNPDLWPGDLAAFYREHYKGVALAKIKVATPAELVEVLHALN